MKKNMPLLILSSLTLLTQTACPDIGQRSNQNVNIILPPTPTPQATPSPTATPASSPVPSVTPFPDFTPTPTPTPTPLNISVPGVSSIAGNGSRGFKDGPAAEAQFNEPTGITVEKDGTVYIADQDNHRIRKLSPEGVVSTFAGRTNGNADGPASTAQFSFPAGVDIDSSGTMYVADSNNHRVRQVTGGNVVTMAGTGQAGFKDGKGAEAQFSTPWDLAVDGNGNVFVADVVNDLIRKITPAGDVTTFAGSENGYADGLGTAARFNRPNGIAVDSAGNIYVADTQNHRIRKITPSGQVSTLAGSGAAGFKEGKGSEAQFRGPLGIVVDNKGTVYVSDTENHRIRKITPDGTVTTAAGSEVEGYADGNYSGAKFNQPRGIAVDAQGNLYVVDLRNDRIRKITF